MIVFHQGNSRPLDAPTQCHREQLLGEGRYFCYSFRSRRWSANIVAGAASSSQRLGTRYVSRSITKSFDGATVLRDATVTFERRDPLHRGRKWGGSPRS